MSRFALSALPAARAFYADVLGLMAFGAEPTGDTNERQRFRVSHRQQIILESGLPAGDDERLSHLAFETSDLDALAVYLKARGIQPETAPPAPARRCSTRALWVKDPDGHPIEFVDRMGNGAPPANTSWRITGGIEPLSTRVLHAGLTIRDAEAADRFYKTVLGFSEIWRGGRADDVTSWINMKVPDGTDYLEYMLVSGPVSRQQLGSLHHVALLVPDIQRALEEAQSRMSTAKATGATMGSPQVGRNKRWQLNLFDPDGTRTELMEPFTMR
jgi:lactoylglutathione lyase